LRSHRRPNASGRVWPSVRDGKRLTFAANVRHGKLVITLKTAALSVQITIASPAISVSRTLADKIRAGKDKTLQLHVTAMATNNSTTKVTISLRAS
jgi:hypothetical protein